MILSKITSKFNFLLHGISARPRGKLKKQTQRKEKFMDKPKKQKKKIIEIPQYNDPMNKEGVIPTDVLGSYSGTPLDGSQPVQDVDDL
jgi:hypothetical protein